MIRKLLFLKCRNGHWFSGKACPVDGYSDDFTDAMLEAEAKLRAEGAHVTLNALLTGHDTYEKAIHSRVMIVETAALASEESCCLVQRIE